MGRLVRFPDLIESLPDADLLDLSVSASLEDRASVAGHIQAHARYASAASVPQIERFYVRQFDKAGATAIQRHESAEGNRVVFDLELPWSPCPLRPDVTTAFQVEMTANRGYRSVRVKTAYDSPDVRDLWHRFSRWHNGDAPVTADCRPTGLEVTTYATGRQPRTQVLYTTHYHCDETSGDARRAGVEDRIRELGWNYRETREGILFMRDVAFEAETHVIGDDQSSVVTFVGEFQLR